MIALFDAAVELRGVLARWLVALARPVRVGRALASSEEAS